MKKKLFIVVALLSMSTLTFGEIIVSEKHQGVLGIIEIGLFILVTLIVFVLAVEKILFKIDVSPTLLEGFLGY
jgi:hypothetical protein